MMKLKPVSLRALVSAIGLAFALITAVALPAVYFTVGYLDAAHVLSFRAELNSRYVARYIHTHGDLWQYQHIRLAEMLDQADGRNATVRKIITDPAGKTVLDQGQPADAPVLVRSHPIVVGGETAGHVGLETSLRRLLAGTGIVAALSTLFGFALYFAVRVFPLRVLDQTIGRLESTNRQFDAALNNMSQGLIMMDKDEKVVVFNDRYIEMYNLSRDVVKPGLPIDVLFRHRVERGHMIRDPEVYREHLKNQRRSGKAGSWILETGDGREISISDVPMADGQWVSTHEDVTDWRAAQAKISHMAMHDALTGLPNRVYFHDQLARRLANPQRGQKFAVLCFDLDRFKSVNDSLGHQYGDMLLRQVAGRLRGCLRDTDTLARLGGDEFAILQGKVDQPTEIGALARRLNEAIGAPFDLNGQQAVIGVSIGISVAPADGSTADQLLKNADMALYRAKTDGRGTYRFFETAMDELMQERRALELDLRRALANGEFELYYQPIVNLARGHVSSFEALLRWNHPQRGIVMPLEFIPLAEETELIVSIGEWVLGDACREAAKWPAHVNVAVNVSSAQFKTGTLTQVVKGALERAGLEPGRLELEITESVLLFHNENTLTTLRELRELGVRISMDDFGTGYSSLSYLRSFPFDKIKIDRSFIHNLGTDADSMAIIRAVAGLGSSLGMETTGEGVETQEELDYLKSEGCTEAQGFFFSRPQPASEVNTMLRNQRPSIKAIA